MAQKQWGNIDQANNSPIWGPSLVGTKANKGTANSANRDALYQNTTANAYTSTAAHSNGVITGVYAVDKNELADTMGEGSKVRAAGWVLRTELPNGRVKMETLVAMKGFSGDDSDTDDTIFPDSSASASTSASSSPSTSPSASPSA